MRSRRRMGRALSVALDLARNFASSASSAVKIRNESQRTQWDAEIQHSFCFTRVFAPRRPRRNKRTYGLLTFAETLLQAG